MCFAQLLQVKTHFVTILFLLPAATVIIVAKGMITDRNSDCVSLPPLKEGKGGMFCSDVNIITSPDDEQSKVGSCAEGKHSKLVCTQYLVQSAGDACSMICYCQPRNRTKSSLLCDVYDMYESNTGLRMRGG